MGPEEGFSTGQGDHAESLCPWSQDGSNNREAGLPGGHGYGNMGSSTQREAICTGSACLLDSLVELAAGERNAWEAHEHGFMAAASCEQCTSLGVR